MVREFYLINDIGEELSLMHPSTCFLVSPTGLGYSYESEYERVGNTFITNIRQMGQGAIGGEGLFLTYEIYRSFINFIETSNKLKLNTGFLMVKAIRNFLKMLKYQVSIKLK